MKQHQSFATGHNNRFLTLLIGIAGILFALSSCCITEEAGKAKSKNCNCKEDKMAVASANMPETSGARAFAGNIENDNNENKINVPETKKVNSALPGDEIQGNAKKKLPLGLKAITSNVFAGVNTGSPSLKDEGLKKKAGVGFQFGIGSHYHFSKNFAVNAMLRFRQNNFSTMEDGGGGFETETDYKYNFISAPILANFRLSQKINLGIGPEVNYLVSATSLTRTSDPYGGDGEEKEKITDRSTRLGMGLEANLSVQLTKRLGINLGVNKGLNNLDKTTESGYGSYGGTNGSWTEFHFLVWFRLCEILSGF